MTPDLVPCSSQAQTDEQVSPG